MERLRFTIKGTSPLICHNGQLCDPLNDIVRKMKEISAKRKKVDADHEELSRLEWYGSLYLNDGHPCIPAENIEAALFGKGGAARKESAGKQAEVALFVDGNAILEYPGPDDIDDLWEDGGYLLRSKVKVKTSSIMRSRPIFREWSTVFTVVYDAQMLDRKDVERWISVSGDIVGVGDWRPRYGRFTVEDVQAL